MSKATARQQSVLHSFAVDAQRHFITDGVQRLAHQLHLYEVSSCL